MAENSPADRPPPDREAGASPLGALRWRDEILQLMYWYQGEGFGASVTAADLQTFLAVDEALLRDHLEWMVAEGYLRRLEEAPPARYAFTDLGRREGARRFADEFAGLTGQAHGECNNPNCSCQTMGPDACESRTAHAH